MKCKSIIEIEKKLRKRKHEKKGPFVPVGNTNRDKRVRQPCGRWQYQPGQKVLFCPGCQTRDKRTPLLSRTGVPGWETGTTAVSQPGQINVFVVVDTQQWQAVLQYRSSYRMQQQQYYTSITTRSYRTRTHVHHARSTQKKKVASTHPGTN